MRSTRARRAISVLLLLALAAAGCGTDQPLPSRTPVAGGVDDSAPPSATAARLAEFEAHLRDATTREGTLARAVAAASSESVADVRLAVGQLSDWAVGERAWLTDHPADPCFDAAASKLEAAIDSIATTAAWLEASVDATVAPSDDVSIPSARTEAVNALQDAARALTDAAALAKTARPNCS
jgi:hypothetical protein